MGVYIDHDSPFEKTPINVCIIVPEVDANLNRIVTSFFMTNIKHSLMTEKKTYVEKVFVNTSLNTPTFSKKKTTGKNFQQSKSKINFYKHNYQLISMKG